MSETRLILRNPAAVPLAELPLLSPESFSQELYVLLLDGWRLCSYFGQASERGGCRLYAVLALDCRNQLTAISCEVRSGFTSLAALCPQVSLFEREIYEQCAVVPEGHPWLKPVRFPGGAVGLTDYYRVEGEQVHEVAVGPVHAGIIEPGHFRFQCHGEEVFHLEISLGYQYRGVEAALEQASPGRAVAMLEAVAGDTTIAHLWAYCLVQEALTGRAVPERADVLRGIALELERLANHTGDLGALAGDVGYLPTASFCGRIRGDFLNLTAELCGSRFGRGLLLPGGSRFNLDSAHAALLGKRLTAAYRDLQGASDLLWQTSTVMSRFEGTGRVSLETAKMLGLVGPAARACGLRGDIRQDHPFGCFRPYPLSPVIEHGGDVLARARQRRQEADVSADWIASRLEELPSGPVFDEGDLKAATADSFAVALVEGWRGELCHVSITGSRGEISRYKITDPSFHNWQGLAMALRGEQISDFPLCNKSFNLSYCGFDL